MIDIKDLKKDIQRSVRINGQLLELLKEKGKTLQSFLDEKLSMEFKVEVKNQKKVRNTKKL